MQDSALQKDLQYQKLGLPNNNLVHVANRWLFSRGAKVNWVTWEKPGQLESRERWGSLEKKGREGPSDQW